MAHDPSRRSRCTSRFACLLLLLASPAFGQDAARGRMLYQTYCGVCHYEHVHDRLKSEVKDLADLRDAVARWAPQTKRSFTLDERENIVQYLNESHYRSGLSSMRRQD